MTDATGGPTPDAGGHLDLDALADALAGERPGDAHLASCASCADRLSELAAASSAVTASLRALPDPELPAGLAERLDTAVRAEPAVAAARVTPLRPARRRAWPQGVAAGLALLLAGGLGYGVLRGGAGGSDTTAADSAAGGAGEAATVAAPRSDSGIDYADEAAVRATLPRVLAGTASGGAGGSAVAAAPPEPQLSATEPSAPSAAGGAPGSAGTFAEQAPADAAVPVSDPLDRLRDPAGLASCLSALLPPDEPDVQPLALDYARFQGQPALAVVLPDPDPARLAVFVVGAGCSQGDDRTLRYVRVDKP